MYDSTLGNLNMYSVLYGLGALATIPSRPIKKTYSILTLVTRFIGRKSGDEKFVQSYMAKSSVYGVNSGPVVVKKVKRNTFYYDNADFSHIVFD